MDTTQRPTPRTDAAFEAFSRGACGTVYLSVKMAELERELAAYIQAKQENDERFMLERDEARRERDNARDERDIARIPICIGKPLIQVLAKEGQWASENGNGLVAADCLFRNDPYAENEAMRAAIQEAVTALRAWPKARHGVSTDFTLQSQAFRTGQSALAALKPFLPETPTK